MDDKFGKLAKDKVTGFTGTIIGRCDYMYGCTQYGVSPKIDKDGKIGNIEWFDEGRIEIIKKSVEPKEVQGRKRGGPNRDCPR